MKLITGTKDFKVKDSAVVLGNVDGIHLGHRLLISKAKTLANENSLQSLVFSFHPHPSRMVKNKQPVPLIYTNSERKEIMKEEAVDIFVEYPFDSSILKMTPELFIKDILVDQLDAKGIIVGEDYRFGVNRKGDVRLLEDYSRIYGYELMIIPKLAYNNRIVSSTWIREELLNGNIELANTLLGKPFSIIGEVIKGKQFGRTMGFPTANIRTQPEKVLPPNGVYISQVILEGKMYNGLTNIGTNPTVNGTNRLVETYILDFDEDIYGKFLNVKLIKYLRTEEKFKSIDALKKQIKKDLLTINEYIGHKTE